MKKFSIPQIILVGRRGAPGIKDEPQHAKIGPKTIKLLKSLDLEYFDLNKRHNVTEIEKDVKKSISLQKNITNRFFNSK